jgi:ribosomal protein S27AE
MSEVTVKRVLIGIFVTAVGGAIANNFVDVLGALDTIWSGVIWALTLKVPVWAILAVLVVFDVAKDLLRSRGDGSEDSPPPEYYEYTSDHFAGLDWTWRWGRYGPTELRAFCPNCNLEVFEKTSYGQRINCDKCGYRTRMAKNPAHMRDYVRKEIERLVRNGEWEKRV